MFHQYTKFQQFIEKYASNAEVEVIQLKHERVIYAYYKLLELGADEKIFMQKVRENAIKCCVYPRQEEYLKRFKLIYNIGIRKGSKKYISD